MKTVLVLDDDAAMVDAFTRYLRLRGFEVEGFTSGAKVVEAVRTHLDTYGAVLSDYVMPGDLDGREVCEALRLVAPNLPVVMMSGNSMGMQRALFRGCNVIGFLEKPFDHEKLVSLLAELVHPEISG